MGMMAILVMFQVYGCNSYHRLIGPVNAYLRPSLGHLGVTFLHVSMFAYVSKIDLDLN